MKTVGKQLQEARLAKNWTPELAARETKIKVDRLRDLEADDYTHFSSPTYARGFVRTYARALGLDEYKVLRQLDNKLPEDDNASFVTESGLSYIPEPSKPARARSTGSNVGLYVVMVLGCGVILIISFVLFEAYRAGELQRYFASASTPDTNSASTNMAPNTAGTEAPARALPLDPHAPPPPVDAAPIVKAAPVDNGAAVAATTNGAPATDGSAPAAKAVAVDPSELTGAPQPTTGEGATNAPIVTADNGGATNIPRAEAVDPNELTNAPPVAPPVTPSTPIAASARASGSAHVAAPPPVPTSTASAAAATATALTGKRLILTASRDSFVRVTALDAPDVERVLYATMLHAGQSAAFDGRKFSVNVGIPSAVDISLDGVNYGPHSDQEAPETFTVESHQP
jgi:cytoskeleton protein RodZ